MNDTKCCSSLAIKSQLRLASALAIATLSQLDSYSQLASVKRFEKLALTVQVSCLSVAWCVPEYCINMIVQDSVFEVRAGFSEMIIRDLQSGALHPRYFAVLFLLAHEPEKDLMRQAKTFLKKHAKVNHGRK
jgi:sister chromatid cohesion protein PDS5